MKKNFKFNINKMFLKVSNPKQNKIQLIKIDQIVLMIKLIVVKVKASSVLKISFALQIQIIIIR